MNIESIKQELAELAKEHDALNMPGLDEIKYAEMIEWDAVRLIISYCEQCGYTVNGFPTEKRKLFEKQELVDGEDEDDYFCTERFNAYIYHLALEKDDVAELLWFYENSFWPGMYATKEDFLGSINLAGFDVTL